MLRWILIKLLRRQYNIWHQELRSLCFIYDCVCLGNDDEVKKIREEKEALFDKLDKLGALENCL